MHSIYLLRHCEYENPLNILPGRLPVPLSEVGKKRALGLHKYFSDKKIDRIISSAVLRCKQTSEIISGGNIPINFDKRLLETLSAYQGYWGENWHGNGFHFFSHQEELEGEGFKDILKRVSAFWDEVSANLQENIIVCGHGDPLQILYSHIRGLPLAKEDSQEENIPGWLGYGEWFEFNKTTNGDMVEIK